ncbi:MAG: DNA polymerase III subunit delta [bacterium]
MSGPRRLANVYLVLGDDDYLVESEVARIVAEARSRAGEDFAVETVDCEEAGVEGVVAELTSPSLFSVNKATVLTHFRLTAENKLAREIERCLASGVPPGEVLVIRADKVDKRLKLAKLIGDQGNLVEVKPPGDAGLRSWIEKRFKAEGKSVAPGVADLLIDLQGEDYRALASEIEKTVTYVGERREVAERDLNAVVGRSRTERIFELASHAIRGEAGKAVEAIADLLDAGDTGTRIVGYVGREIRYLIQIKLFMRARPGLWDRGTTFQEFRQETVTAFRAWLEAGRISEADTCLYQKPYAVYLKFREAEGAGLDGLLDMLERLVETNKFLVSKSVDNKDKLALEAWVSAASGGRGNR